MRAYLLLVMAASFTGCAERRVVLETNYAGLGNVKKIVQADATTVDKECAHEVEDDGTPAEKARTREVVMHSSRGEEIGSYKTYEKTQACWHPDTGTVWMAFESSAKTLLHELCHAAMGLTPKECADRFPND